jgi:ferredoxin
MKRSYTALRIGRIVFSLAVLVVYLAAFLLSGFASLKFLRALTWFQAAPSFLRSVAAGAGFAAAGFLPVLLLTLIFGRVYCSGLCPFGTLQDGIIRLSPKRRRYRFSYDKPRHLLRYGFLLLLLISAAAGTMLFVNITEPYSLFSRSVRDILMPAVTAGSQGLFYVLKPMDIFIAPLDFPIEFWVTVLSLVSVAVIFVFAFRKGRIFCNTICPVGSVLSLCSRFSLFRIGINDDACTRCMRCERACKAECINAAAGTVDNSRCIRCFNCLSRCRDDAIDFTMRPLPSLFRRKNRGRASAAVGQRAGSSSHMEAPAGKPECSGVSGGGISRRQFLQRFSKISIFSVFPVSFVFRKRSAGPESRKNAPASPPGSGSVAAFTSRCVSCHLCVSRCPTKVLQPSLFEYGIEGVMQPVMDYGSGFCEYECTVCSEVCPAGAIMPISVQEKTRTQIGTSRFILERCVIFTKGTACGACAEVCPTQAVYMVPYKGTLYQPKTDNAICIGCGNCEFSCPVEGGKAIYVIGSSTHKRIEERAKSDRDRPAPEEAEEGRPADDGSPAEGGETEDKKGFPF